MIWSPPHSQLNQQIDTAVEPLDQTCQRIGRLPPPDSAEITEVLHVGLLVPPSPLSHASVCRWQQTAPFAGPSIIAGLLKGLGYRVTLLDQRLSQDPDDLWSLLQKLDIVAITCYADNYPYLKQATEIAKAQNPGRPVILGGPLATALPELMLADTAADYVVVGEGELTLTELMDHLSFHPHAKPLKDIRGLAWKDKDHAIHRAPARPPLRNLDNIPFQDLSSWPACTEHEVPLLYFNCGRRAPDGTPSRPPLVIHKSLKRVDEELSYYRRYNFRLACFTDTFLISDEHYLHALLDGPLKTHSFGWSCCHRIENVDLKLLYKMHARGCKSIMYELEPITLKLLQSYRQKDLEDQTVRAIHFTRKAGIKFKGICRIQTPTQSRESLQALFNFCHESKAVSSLLHQALIPGTAAYRQAVSENIILDERAHLYSLTQNTALPLNIAKFDVAITAEKKASEYRYHQLSSGEEPYNRLLKTSAASTANPHRI